MSQADKAYCSFLWTRHKLITIEVFKIFVILILQKSICCLAKTSSATNSQVTHPTNNSRSLNLIHIRGGGGSSSSPSSSSSSATTTVYETEISSKIVKPIPKEEYTDTVDMSPSPLQQQHRKEQGQPIQKIEFVFSDVDGTLVHFPKHDNDTESSHNDENMLQLPTSSTGMRGVISCKSLVLCQELRSKGVKLILVSGMRTSTLIKRLPYLPRADAYACEAGGRIFYPVDNDRNSLMMIHPRKYNGISSIEELKPFGIVEDLEWRSRMSSLDAAGMDGYDTISGSGNNRKDASQRSGLLWDFARTLMDKGFVIDSNGYASCFRVNKSQQDYTKITEEDFESLKKLMTSDDCNKVGSLPDGLATSVNLGCIDFYPLQSGKKNCCAYLAKYFSENKDHHKLSPDDGSSILSENAVCMCDDDNDLQMARACSKAFVPSITSESMLDAVNEESNQFVVTENKDKNIVETFATEAALSTILNQLLVSS